MIFGVLSVPLPVPSLSGPVPLETSPPEHSHVIPLETARNLSKRHSPCTGATVLHRPARLYEMVIQGATLGATNRNTGCYFLKSLANSECLRVRVFHRK